jgi:hypothetical protein
VVFAAPLEMTTVVTASAVEQTHFFHCEISEVVALEKDYYVFHFLPMAVELQHYHHLW